jgi:hypothetical protein
LWQHLSNENPGEKQLLNMKKTMKETMGPRVSQGFVSGRKLHGFCCWDAWLGSWPGPRAAEFPWELHGNSKTSMRVSIHGTHNGWFIREDPMKLLSRYRCFSGLPPFMERPKYMKPHPLPHPFFIDSSDDGTDADVASWHRADEH